MANKKIILGELFSGPGGIAIGAEMANESIKEFSDTEFTHGWAVDYHDETVATYRRNVKGADEKTAIVSDVREITAKQLAMISKIDGFAYGFPCNDFGAQEPGSNDEIKAFCTSKYEVTFPMMDKIHVKGSDQSPLYAALTGPESKFPGDVRWNFGKFLIGRNGEVLARFEPSMKPDSPEVLAAINGALKASSHK